MADSRELAVLVLNEVGKLLRKLTEEQVSDLAAGRAVIEFRSADVTIASRAARAAAKPKAPKPVIDLDEMIREIKGFTEEDAVERYLLERDKAMSVAQLRELAEKIGPPVSTKGTKAQLRKNIAAGTAGLLNRPASVFSGGWDR